METDDDFEILDQIFKLIRPLTPQRRVRLVRVLSTMMSVQSTEAPETSVQTWSERLSARTPYSQDLSITPKQFLIEKQPKSDVERIACLAFYLTHYRDIPHFKTIDLSKLNTEAAQPRLSNPNYATKNALSYGYLAQATKGLRQLSAAGEQFVNVLPDRQAAKAVMANAMKRRRPKKRIQQTSAKSKAK